MSEHLLGQDEIDALLSRDLLEESEDTDEGADLLGREEMDALGEIGNISMGSAATTLSQILNRKVSITSPVVKLIPRGELFANFVIPHLLITIKYTEGLEGTTLLVMETGDAAVLADLMMGGEGVNPSRELTEIEVSAASEAMNQMIGTASTSMATLFRRTVNIGPPETRIVSNRELSSDPPLDQDPLVAIHFKIVVEDLIDNTIMQILDLRTAKAEAALLWNDVQAITAKPERVAASPAPASPAPAADQTRPADRPADRLADAGTPTPTPTPSRTVTVPVAGGVDPGKLDMLLDIPLKVSVILGRTRQPVKEVLNMTPGAVMGLDITVDEPVDILLNGTLVAKWEVVVVDENFGVRITSILSPMERLQNLRR